MSSLFRHDVGTTHSMSPFTPGQVGRPQYYYETRQPHRHTSGGVRYSYAPTISEKIMKLTLRMNESEKDVLLMFFRNSANGMANWFYYIHAGITQTVQFNTPELPDLTEVAYQVWEGNFELRVLS